MDKATVEDLSGSTLRGARVLVRVDFNVPIEGDGSVGDDTRIRATLPTLRLLIESGARLILVSHLGRPKGKPDPKLSLRPVADRLSELLGSPVEFVGETVGSEAKKAVDALAEGGVVLLENTRFQGGEKENDPELADALASFADLYVNDAFGAAHRAHASTAGVAEAVRRNGGSAVAGLLVARELEALGRVRENPERPFVAILGGAKISGKIDVIEALLPAADRMCIGGAMANTFFQAMGLDTGESMVEPERVDMARELLDRAGDKILLPVDCVVGEEISSDASVRNVDRNEVGGADKIGDIGPRSREIFAREILGAKTLLWNGPMGVFEMEPYAEGTLHVARSLAEATDEGAVTVVGGGDSAAAAEAADVAERLTHISTGGGASLDLMAGKPLPGVEALDRAQDSDHEENS